MDSGVSGAYAGRMKYSPRMNPGRTGARYHGWKLNPRPFRGGSSFRRGRGCLVFLVAIPALAAAVIAVW